LRISVADSFSASKGDTNMAIRGFKSTRARRLVAHTLAGAIASLTLGTALASSHREAPMITQYPKVDNTDTYAFRSYEAGREGYVVVLANYVPLQDAYGGPNYFAMDPDALYEIHLDTNGDAKEDLTFSFKFTNTIRGTALNVGGKMIPIPLVNSGSLTTGNQPQLNFVQTYTVDLIKGARRSGTKTSVGNLLGGNQFEKPMDNIGNRSIPNYSNYAAMHIRGLDIPGCTPPAGSFPRVFVGQRKEGFGVNLGEIFDLVNIPTAKVIGSRSGSGNATQYKNVTTIAMEIPISCITSADDPVVGVWASASLPARKLNLPDTSNVGGFVQVSRLGMPLVNELVIGIPDKDKFNMSEPKDDAQFLDYVTNPTLPALLEALFGKDGVTAPATPRNDLVAAFLTGVPSVNQAKVVTPSEMIRLNTALPATPKGKQNSLGAAACFVAGTLTLSNPGCDPAGFPNGRRPGDDVVDIALRVAMGYLLKPGAGKPASADLPYTDGVLVEDSQFDNAFPFLNTPLPGSPNGANGL
jgi:hypothetical protein